MTEPAWGDADTGGDGLGDDTIPDSIDVGNGLVLRINKEQFRKAMNSQTVKSQVDERGEAIAATANSLAITRGAVYEYRPSTNPHNTRARGRVVAANYKAVVDDQHHSTLMKALAAHPSDPKPETDEVP